MTQHEAFVTRRALRYEITRLTEEVVKAENAAKPAYSAVAMAELEDAQRALAIFD
jgi:hypothetical protein